MGGGCVGAGKRDRVAVNSIVDGGHELIVDPQHIAVGVFFVEEFSGHVSHCKPDAVCAPGLALPTIWRYSPLDLTVTLPLVVLARISRSAPGELVTPSISMRPLTVLASIA